MVTLCSPGMGDNAITRYFESSKFENIRLVKMRFKPIPHLLSLGKLS